MKKIFEVHWVERVSNVVVNAFMSLLTLYRPKHSFVSIWEVINLINTVWKQNWIVENVLLTECGFLYQILN